MTDRPPEAPEVIGRGSGPRSAGGGVARGRVENNGYVESMARPGARSEADNPGADAGATGPLLTARTVADQFGVSTETVLRWPRRGELPSIHLSNRAIRFVKSEIEEWMRSRARAARGNGAHSV